MSLMREGRTLYTRDPEKNYAFVKVGTVATWESYSKALFIAGVLYTMNRYEPEVSK